MQLFWIIYQTKKGSQYWVLQYTKLHVINHNKNSYYQTLLGRYHPLAFCMFLYIKVLLYTKALLCITENATKNTDE